MWGVVAALVVVAVALLVFVVRFDRSHRHAFGDTYFYALQAAEFAGVPRAQAEFESRRLICSDDRHGLRLDGSLSHVCADYQVITRPRYVAIFTSRPLWPLLLAPGVRMLGLPRGVLFGSVLGAALAALAVYLALRGLGSSPLAAGAAGIAVSLLPTGYEADKLLPEGAVLVALVAGIYAAARVVRGHWPALAILVPAVVALYAFKPANGAALAGGLLVAGAVLLPFGRKGRLRALAVAGVGAAGVGGWFLVSSLLGLPSFYETVQDLATRHFAKPDAPHPLHVLADMNRLLWSSQVERWLGLPRPLVVVLPAAIVTVLGLRRAGVVWAAVSLAAVAIVVAHPLISQYDRLVVSIWLTVPASLAVLVDLALRRLRLLPVVPSGPSAPVATDPHPIGAR